MRSKNFQHFFLHLIKILGLNTGIELNAFKCNLKELTTKSSNSTHVQRSVFKHLHNCAVFHSCGVGLAVRGVSVSQHGQDHSPYSSPPSLPFLSTVLQCDGCLFLSLVHGGSWLGCSVVPAMGALFSLGAGCLPKVEALGHSRHPTSTKRCSC